jgi:hypothetical protein
MPKCKRASGYFALIYNTVFKFTLISLIGGLIVGLIVWGFYRNNTHQSKLSQARKTQIQNTIRNGDIVLIRSHTLRSDIVRALDTSQTGYSHVGICTQEPPNTWIVHASPASTQKKVTRQTLQDFLNSNTVGQITLLRAPQALGPLIAQYADSVWKHHVPFDDTFNHNDSRALYCTELVVNALKQAGFSLECLHSEPILLPGFSHQVYFPSALLRCEFPQGLQTVGE